VKCGEGAIEIALCSLTPAHASAPAHADAMRQDTRCRYYCSIFCSRSRFAADVRVLFFDIHSPHRSGFDDITPLLFLRHYFPRHSMIFRHYCHYCHAAMPAAMVAIRDIAINYRH